MSTPIDWERVARCLEAPIGKHSAYWASLLLAQGLDGSGAKHWLRSANTSVRLRALHDALVPCVARALERAETQALLDAFQASGLLVLSPLVAQLGARERAAFGCLDQRFGAAARRVAQHQLRVAQVLNPLRLGGAILAARSWHAGAAALLQERPILARLLVQKTRR